MVCGRRHDQGDDEPPCIPVPDHSRFSYRYSSEHVRGTGGGEFFRHDLLGELGAHSGRQTDRGANPPAPSQDGPGPGNANLPPGDRRVNARDNAGHEEDLGEGAGELDETRFEKSVNLGSRRSSNQRPSAGTKSGPAFGRPRRSVPGSGGKKLDVVSR